jgi:NitT/TauT family transport system ATP-binding protein
MANDVLMEAVAVCKSFKTPDRAGRLVLDRIDFRLRDGEIVAVLGKSGSGKSTFLRILAGLVEPSSGHVDYRGHAVHGPAHGIAMVFQSFALFPWLTVLQCRSGLKALGCRT